MPRCDLALFHNLEKLHLSKEPKLSEEKIKSYHVVSESEKLKNPTIEFKYVSSYQKKTK